MKQSALLRLNNTHWIEDVIDGDPLALAIVPSAGSLTGALMFDPLNENGIRRVCQKLFVDFRGYTDDDDKPVPNTLAARIELYGFPLVRQTIAMEIDRLNTEAAQGEENAASD